MNHLPVIFNLRWENMMSLMWPNHNQARTDVQGVIEEHFYLAVRLGVHACFCCLLQMDVLIVHAQGGRGEGESGREEVLRRAQGSLCFSTSGLYIKPLINPEWRPGSDRLTGQAPVQDRAWFITSELQPALIYFRRREGESGGGVFQGIQGVDTETALLDSVGRCWGGEWPGKGA